MIITDYNILCKRRDMTEKLILKKGWNNEFFISKICTKIKILVKFNNDQTYELERENYQ